jgi:NAD(P)-dependent dehydrogenase (short-subunit alcohol dehydrogenase family)
MTATDNSPVPDYQSLLRLDGKGYIVVGAGVGMGRQTTHALAQAGAKVVCVDVDVRLAKEIADEVGGVAWAGDATKREEVERLVADSVRELGRIDGVVDIIGMARYQSILDMEDETWDWEFDICLRHAYLVSQAAARVMKDTGGGTLTFIGSVSGMTGAPNHAAYGAAKAGLISWIRSLAEELGPHGIRANGVAPGVVWTPRVSALLGDAGKATNAANSPLRRVALPADIAAAALFLSTDLSGYITGQTIVVDGGVGVKFPYPMDF